MPDPDRVVVVYSVVPDFCTMPDGSVVPFDLFATYKDSQNESSSVFANGHGAMKIDTRLTTCTGDEAAVGGVKSGTVAGQVEMLPNQCTVNINGKQAVRKNDLASMNNNTIGVVDVLTHQLTQDVSTGILGEVGQAVHDDKKQIRKYQRAKKRFEKNKTRDFRNGNARNNSNRTLKNQMRKATSRMKNPGARRLPVVATGTLRRVPVVMSAISVLDSGNELRKGNNKEALKKASSGAIGIGVGMAGAKACGALTLSGIGTAAGLTCFGLTALASYVTSKATEELVEEFVPEPEKCVEGPTADGYQICIRGPGGP